MRDAGAALVRSSHDVLKGRHRTGKQRRVVECRRGPHECRRHPRRAVGIDRPVHGGRGPHGSLVRAQVVIVVIGELAGEEATSIIVDEHASDIPDEIDRPIAVSLVPEHNPSVDEKLEHGRVQVGQLFDVWQRPVALAAVAKHSTVDVVVDPPPGNRVQGAAYDLMKRLMPGSQASQPESDGGRVDAFGLGAKAAVVTVELVEQMALDG